MLAGAESTTFQTLGSVGELLAGAAATIGVPLAFRQLRVGRRLAKEARAYDYADQLQGLEMIPVVAEAREFWRFGRKRGTNEAMQWFNSMSDEQRLRVVHPMNFLEQVGQMYADDFIDRQLVEKYLGTTAEAYFNESKWFIQRVRDHRKAQGAPGGQWERWEQMLEDFKHKPEPWHSGDLFPGGRPR